MVRRGAQQHRIGPSARGRSPASAARRRTCSLRSGRGVRTEPRKQARILFRGGSRASGLGPGIAAHLEVFVNGQRPETTRPPFRYLDDAAAGPVSSGREMGGHPRLRKADRAVLDLAFLGVEDSRHRLPAASIFRRRWSRAGATMAAFRATAMLDIADRLDGIVHRRYGCLRSSSRQAFFPATV